MPQGILSYVKDTLGLAFTGHSLQPAVHCCRGEHVCSFSYGRLVALMSAIEDAGCPRLLGIPPTYRPRQLVGVLSHGCVADVS